jgi:hypothetical protein
MIIAADILDVTRKVTRKWTNQRKAEERGRKSRASRVYVYSGRVDFTEVAHEILPGGYAHASGNGYYTVDKRQFYYAVRDQFREKTGREITADYFSQTLLVQYMNRNPASTASWKITASPRGTLSIPNTGHDERIPCGTIAIQEHLDERDEDCDPFEVSDDVLLKVQWPSLAEGQRYQGVLYIEKEGFDPQLREARIADLFDIAVISCKGQSVTAARMFVDYVCRVNGGVPLYVAHDMDKAGFEICQRLTTISDHAREHDLVKYEFKNEINVTDLGLRLTDANRYGLKSERFQFRGRFPGDTIATPEEQAFLRSNRRVELNAFTAPQFIEWIKRRLSECRLRQRLIPADDILHKAYRRALIVARINQAIKDGRKKAIEDAKSAEIPNSLRRQLQKELKDSAYAWDKVLYGIAQKKLAFLE